MLQTKKLTFICVPKSNTGTTNYNIEDIETIGQFTGLYDKNGKEIYEGDIFEVDDWTNGVVVYLKDRGSYGFSFKDDDGELLTEPFSYYNFNVMEVLGNEVDNPDLLGE